jgi:hypothetical protein
MSKTRVRSLDTKKSGRFEKTLSQSIPNSFGHIEPMAKARRTSPVPRPSMRAMGLGYVESLGRPGGNGIMTSGEAPRQHPHTMNHLGRTYPQELRLEIFFAAR